MAKQTKVRLTVAIATLIALMIIAIVIGTEPINPFTIGGDPIKQQIIFKLRMPRMIAAVMSGMTLAASGVLIQNSMQNQLADSSILGFQSGATLVAMIIMLIVPSAYPLLPLFALLGGLAVYAVIFAIGARKQGALYLIVTGIAISAIIRSAINFVIQIRAEDIENTIAWTNGTLSTVSISDSVMMLGYGSVLLIIVFAISSKLDLLLLDDEYLLNLGLSPNKLRLIATTLAIFLTAVSVSFVGTISFVGLLGPHIARRLVSNSSRDLVPMSIIVGGLLVLGSDTLQRIIFPIYEVPVGTVMSLVGGTYLVILLVRSDDVKIR